MSTKSYTLIRGKSIILKQNTMFSVVWTRDEITRKTLKLDVGPLTNGKIR